MIPASGCFLVACPKTCFNFMQFVLLDGTPEDTGNISFTAPDTFVDENGDDVTALMPRNVAITFPGFDVVADNIRAASANLTKGQLALGGPQTTAGVIQAQVAGSVTALNNAAKNLNPLNGVGQTIATAAKWGFVLFGIVVFCFALLIYRKYKK